MWRKWAGCLGSLLAALGAGGCIADPTPPLPISHPPVSLSATSVPLQRIPPTAGRIAPPFTEIVATLTRLQQQDQAAGDDDDAARRAYVATLRTKSIRDWAGWITAVGQASDGRAFAQLSAQPSPHAVSLNRLTPTVYAVEPGQVYLSDFAPAQFSVLRIGQAVRFSGVLDDVDWLGAGITVRVIGVTLTPVVSLMPALP